MINNMGANKLSAYGNMGLTSNKELLKLYNDSYASQLESALTFGNENDITMGGLSGLYSMKDAIDETLEGITDKTSDEYKNERH